MITLDQLWEGLRDGLTTQLPNFYKEIQPFLATQANGQNTPVILGALLVQPTQDIEDGLYLEPSKFNQVIEGMSDCVLRNYPQYIMHGYYGMDDITYRTNEPQFDVTMNDILKKVKNPLIVSCCVDLYALYRTSQNLKYNKKDKSWKIYEVPIYEMPPTAYRKECDNTLLIMDRTEAPWIDFANKEQPHAENCIVTSDLYNSMEIFKLKNLEYGSNINNYLVVQSLLPIYYNPNAKIHKLMVDIDYTK